MLKEGLDDAYRFGTAHSTPLDSRLRENDESRNPEEMGERNAEQNTTSKPPSIPP